MRRGRMWNLESREKIKIITPLSFCLVYTLSVSFFCSFSLSIDLPFLVQNDHLSETFARVSTNGTWERERKAPPRMTTLRHSSSAFRSKSPPDFDELFAPSPGTRLFPLTTIGYDFARRGFSPFTSPHERSKLPKDRATEEWRMGTGDQLIPKKSHTWFFLWIQDVPVIFAHSDFFQSILFIWWRVLNKKHFFSFRDVRSF